MLPGWLLADLGGHAWLNRSCGVRIYRPRRAARPRSPVLCLLPTRFRPDAMKRFSRRLRPPSRSFHALLGAALLGTLALPVTAQTVSVGAGSYSLTRPSGEVGPRSFTGQAISPKVDAGFAQPIQSNDYWSSLLFPFFGDPYSNILYAQPLAAKATAAGPPDRLHAESIFVANDFLFPFQPQLTVGVAGLAASRAVPSHYGDWTVTARWAGGAAHAGGHARPRPAVRLFRDGGGRARFITTASTPSVWSNADGVLGLTIGGRHYGVFAPSGVAWTGTGTLRSSLAASRLPVGGGAAGREPGHAGAVPPARLRLRHRQPRRLGLRRGRAPD